MPERRVPLRRRLALGEDDDGPAAKGKGGLLIAPLPPRARVLLRLDPKLLSVESLADFAFSLSINRCLRAGAKRTLRLGPDEWLLCGEETAASQIARDLEAALEGLPHALVDVSHAQVALSVSGPRAQGAINMGCPLDLSSPAFPPGAATRTLLGRIEIILSHWEEGGFEVECARSLAAYAQEFLNLARNAG
jgi:sarcosine oxidase subunit gamma